MKEGSIPAYMDFQSKAWAPEKWKKTCLDTALGHQCEPACLKSLPKSNADEQLKARHPLYRYRFGHSLWLKRTPQTCWTYFNTRQMKQNYTGERGKKQHNNIRYSSNLISSVNMKTLSDFFFPKRMRTQIFSLNCHPKLPS